MHFAAHRFAKVIRGHALPPRFFLKKCAIQCVNCIC